MLSKPKQSASTSLLLAWTGLKWGPSTSWSNIEAVSHKTCPQAEQTSCWRIRTLWMSASSSRCGEAVGHAQAMTRPGGRGLRPALIILGALQPAAVRLSPAGDTTRDQSRPQVRLGRFLQLGFRRRVLKKPNNPKQNNLCSPFNFSLHHLEQVWSGNKTLSYSDANHPGSWVNFNSAWSTFIVDVQLFKINYKCHNVQLHF